MRDKRELRELMEKTLAVLTSSDKTLSEHDLTWLIEEAKREASSSGLTSLVSQAAAQARYIGNNSFFRKDYLDAVTYLALFIANN